MKQSKFYQIKNITEHEYTLVGCDGSVITRPIQDIDKSASAFIIQDANDGDVLVNGSNIFIFRFINHTRIMGYCHVNINDGRFYDDIGKNECFCLIDAEITPATKEQRDLLFQKMKEAGYEWDADKKELKNVSQRMISAEAKETLYGKTAWSEEDEKMFKSLKTLLNNASCYSCTEGVDKILSWLKSFKDRISYEADCTIKQEWSEEDSLQLNAAIDICKHSGHTVTSDWLKSIKSFITI